MFKDFNFPGTKKAEAFWKVQEILGKKGSRYNRYFRYLIYQVDFCKDFSSLSQANFKKEKQLDNFYFAVIDFLIRLFSKFFLISKTKFVKSDILIDPSFSVLYRKSEKQFLLKLVQSLLSKGLTIAIVSPSTHQLPEIILPEINNPEFKKRIIFFDPDILLSSTQDRLVKKVSNKLANLEFSYINQLLINANIQINSSFLNALKQCIYRKISWVLFEKAIDFNLAILRCEWDDYSSEIKEIAKAKKRKVMSFQHGVVSHTLDIPISVDRYFVFGSQSAQVLNNLNQEFSQITGQTNLCSDFQPCGSITDPIFFLENNFEKRSVLIIDQSVTRVIDFYGIAEQIKALNCLISKLLLISSINKVILRSHPESIADEAWQFLKDKYPEKFELSNAQNPHSLEEDITRSSVAIGLFSGVLSVSATSGLPTYFLSLPNAYYTPDLDCFRDYILSEEQILLQLAVIMENQEKYLEASQKCIEIGKLYYHNRTQLELNDDFIENCLLNGLNL